MYGAPIDPETTERLKISLTRTRARYRYVEKTIKQVSYRKVEDSIRYHPSETTYEVLRANRVIGYVGLKRRENWRKHGRIRTSLIGLSRDWWSGSAANPGSRSQFYTEYSYSRTRATEILLENLYDLSHPEIELA